METTEPGEQTPGGRAQFLSGELLDRKPGYKIHQLRTKPWEIPHYETQTAPIASMSQRLCGTVAEVLHS
nr:hypothetical protein [uncultured Cupriavidus sp.]